MQLCLQGCSRRFVCARAEHERCPRPKAAGVVFEVTAALETADSDIEPLVAFGRGPQPCTRVIGPRTGMAWLGRYTGGPGAAGAP